MCLLASNKLECTDKATVTYWSVCSSLPSRAHFNHCSDPIFSFLAFLPGFSIYFDWLFEHALIIGKEAWHNREHVLFLRACSVSQTGHTDRRTDASGERSNVGLLTLAPNYIGESLITYLCYFVLHIQYGTVTEHRCCFDEVHPYSHHKCFCYHLL